MSDQISPGLVPARLSLAGPITRRLRAHLARLVEGLEHGALTLTLPDRSVLHHAGRAPGPHAVLTLRRWRPIIRLLLQGDLGFAETFISGDWTSPDLVALLTLAAQNADLLDALKPGIVSRLLTRLVHAANANTRRGSRRNIRAHYDLGNAFYAAWLDAGMSYSAALYDRPGLSLEAAQLAKQDRVLALLEVKAGQHVLEIGCGWGGLMERIAGERCAHVLGLTLSPAQAEFARTRLRKVGLDARTCVALEDYRDVNGIYDRIVSIEMFEAVGMRYWRVFFSALRARLAASGHAILQVITIAEARFDAYVRQPDFIQTYVFPGGMLPTRTALAERAAAAGLALSQIQLFGADYAATLAAWSERFERAWPVLRRQGFDEAFRRKWRYYFAYCEAGFRTGALDVGLYRVAHASQ